MAWTNDDLARRDDYPYLSGKDRRAFILEVGADPVFLAPEKITVRPLEAGGRVQEASTLRPVSVEGRLLDTVDFELTVRRLAGAGPWAGTRVLPGYIPMLAVGSNAAPAQLQRKFQAWKVAPGHDRAAPILCMPIRLQDLAPVFSAHISPYGAIPLTLGEVPGWHDLFVVFLPSELMYAMNASESLGINYCLGRWQADPAKVDLSYEGELPFAYTYLSRHGVLEVGGEFVPYVRPAGGKAPSAIGQKALRALLWPTLKDNPVIAKAMGLVEATETESEAAARKGDPLGGLLIEERTMFLVSQALKDVAADHLPSSVSVVAGSNGFAQHASRVYDPQINLIPSGERTFSNGLMRALVSSTLANRVSAADRAEGRRVHRWVGRLLGPIEKWFEIDRPCVLISFHRLARQEVRVLCRLRSEDFGAGVKIYGGPGLARLEAEKIREKGLDRFERLQSAAKTHPDTLRRGYIDAYQAGTVCVVPQSIRGALGHAFDDTRVMARIEPVDIGLRDRLREIVGFLSLGWQDGYVRVAKLPIEDMEKSIARIQPNVIDVLGTLAGYEGVLESVCRVGDRNVYKRKTVRALQCTKDHMAERVSREDFSPSLKARYVNADALFGVSDSHPIVMLDRSARTDLLTNDEDSSYPDEGPETFLQPLRIRRSNLGVFQKEVVLLFFSLAAFTYGTFSLLNNLPAANGRSSNIFWAVFVAAAMTIVSMSVRYRRRAVKFRSV